MTTSLFFSSNSLMNFVLSLGETITYLLLENVILILSIDSAGALSNLSRFFNMDKALQAPLARAGGHGLRCQHQVPAPEDGERHLRIPGRAWVLGNLQVIDPFSTHLKLFVFEMIEGVPSSFRLMEAYGLYSSSKYS